MTRKSKFLPRVLSRIFVSFEFRVSNFQLEEGHEVQPSRVFEGDLWRIRSICWRSNCEAAGGQSGDPIESRTEQAGDAGALPGSSGGGSKPGSARIGPVPG